MVMAFSWISILLLLAGLLCLLVGATKEDRQYCIIGAGPAGLQLGYFLHRAGRDYVIFEKNSTVGAFFLHYPRHRTLISINKRFTGSTNKEFSFRHDWNTLISDDESLQMRHYSKKYFPHADDYWMNQRMNKGCNLQRFVFTRILRKWQVSFIFRFNKPMKVHYLQDYARKLDLKVQLNTEIVQVDRLQDQSELFHLRDQNGNTYLCPILIVSTGLWVPNIPADFRGIEHVVGYESVSIDPDDFEGKLVLILGRGNAGFETADNIVGSAAYIHMASRSRIKMAFQTHYVGDLRAVNNQLVDTYQLKSLDGQFEAELTSEDGATIEEVDGRFYLRAPGAEDLEDQLDNALFEHPYDIIIRCLGFKFDFTIFNERVRPHRAPAGGDKYPHIKANYEAVDIPGMYFAGASTHSLDYRKSAGAFIHGYRYTVRALFHYLEWRYQGIPWPSLTFPASDLLNHLVKRINEASGPYQMFGVLADIALLRANGSVVYLEEVPLQALPVFQDMTGHEIQSFIMWNFEYGKDYSGPDKDVLREDRAIGDPITGDESNFLHPVLYYYRNPPTPGGKWDSGSFPKPDLYHHIVEDFLTNWTARKAHIIPLRRFLEAILQQDLRNFFAETCFELILTYGDSIPLSCQQHYLKGLGVSSSDGIIDFGPPQSFEDL